MGLCPHALCTHHTNTALTPHRRKLLQAGLLSEAEVKRLQIFQGFRPFVLHVWALRSLQVCELHMRMHMRMHVRMHMHAALLHSAHTRRALSCACKRKKYRVTAHGHTLIGCARSREVE